MPDVFGPKGPIVSSPDRLGIVTGRMLLNMNGLADGHPHAGLADAADAISSGHRAANGCIFGYAVVRGT